MVKRSEAKLTGAIIAGLLIVPATAITALAIVGSVSRAPAAQAATGTTTTTMAVAETTAATSTTEPVDKLSDDEALVEACTSEADDLLEKELDQSINGVEAAALDALREICAANGMPIAGPPAPAPIVQVVTVSGSPTSAPVSDGYTDHDQGDDDEDHDEEEDEDHDEGDDDEDQDD